MSTTKKRIKLRKININGTEMRWIEETGFVLRSRTDRRVIGKFENGEFTELNDEIAKKVSEQGMEYDKDLLTEKVEDEDEVEEESEDKENEDKEEVEDNEDEDKEEVVEDEDVEDEEVENEKEVVEEEEEKTPELESDLISLKEEKDDFETLLTDHVEKILLKYKKLSREKRDLENQLEESRAEIDRMKKKLDVIFSALK